MIDSLLAKVTTFFPKHGKTCLKNILILSIAMLRKETVCLNRLKNSVGEISGKPETKSNSNYKRLIRIFDNYSFSSLWLDLLKYVFILLRLESKHILLDGTSWKHGSKWHHYMTLCIVYRGVAIPFFWLDLNKHGLSNLKERKKLFLKAKRHFNLRGKTLLADREYIGKEWFKFLKLNDIEFIIRSKSKAYADAINAAEGKTYEQLIKKVLRSKIPNKAVRKKFVLNGVPLYFIVVKNPNGDAKEPVIFLITSINAPAPNIAAQYSIRWKIEHCFKHLKSNGFSLESINLKGSARQKLLMAVMIFAYTLSVMEGLKNYDKVSIKKYADGRISKAESVFRVGINQLAQYFSSLTRFCEFITSEIHHALYGYRSAIFLNV